MKASLNKISKSFYINLDRRQDRRDHIESTLSFSCERFPAVDGQSLELNPLVKKLFPENFDKITKAEAACAMSHYTLWRMLCDDDAENYLILEDDVIFEKGFTTFWNNIHSLLLPDEYNLVYLGGCQPWNKPEYHKCLERYNDCFNRIKKNDFFHPDSRYWHMTTSSYIISKKGAAELCNFVDEHGFSLALDHFMIFIANSINSNLLYHSHPLMARQLHEENDNTGIDKNSDIRNDKDTFHLPNNTLNVIWQGMGGKTKKPWKDPDLDFIIETDWLLYLLGDLELNHINDDSYSIAQDNSIVIYSDIWPADTKHVPEPKYEACMDNNTRIRNYFEKFKDFKNCYLIHLSDEHCLAERSHYKYFKHVFRNIYSDAIKESNVTFFPLGYKLNTTKSDKKKPIPKTIVQTGHSLKNSQEAIGKVLLHNKDYEYVYYNDDDCIKFLDKYFTKEVVDAFNAFKPGAFKADLFRYCYLYIKGGVYLDLDMRPLISFDKIIDKDANFISCQERCGIAGIFQGFMACTPGISFLKTAIEMIVRNTQEKYYPENKPGENHYSKYLAVSACTLLYKATGLDGLPQKGYTDFEDIKMYLYKFDSYVYNEDGQVIIDNFLPYKSGPAGGNYEEMFNNRDIYN